MSDTDHNGYVRAATRVLTSPTGGHYKFDAGAFSMELLTTGGPGPWQKYEILHRPSDLVTWLTGSGMALDNPLAETDLRIGGRELARIKAFRDALWRIAPALVHGEPADPRDLAVVNDAAGAPPRTRLDPATGRQAWVTPVTGTQVLAAAARDTIDLLGTDRIGRLRQCQGRRCYLMFADTSRPGNRRWCSMERCGNLSKVAGYRARAAQA